MCILSVEDEPDSIAAQLDSLEYAGHRVTRLATIQAAAERLGAYAYDVVLLDQRYKPSMGGQYGGQKLLRRLKGGNFGRLNIHVSFAFVTGSETLVDRDAVVELQGFMDILLKGSGLTRSLKRQCRSIVPRAAAGLSLDDLDRVLVRVEETLGDRLTVVVPGWDVHQRIEVSADGLPAPLARRRDQLAGERLFAWMNLGSDSGIIDFHGSEIAEPPDADDGLGEESK